MREILESKMANAGIAENRYAKLTDEDFLEYFLETFSLRAPVITTVVDTEVVKENARMRDELKTIYGVDKPFICGVAGEVQADGMNEFVLVCPAYGADGMAMYKKYKDYSAPEY